MRKKGHKMFSSLIMGENCPVSNSLVDFADKKSAVNETFDGN